MRRARQKQSSYLIINDLIDVANEIKAELNETDSAREESLNSWGINEEGENIAKVINVEISAF